MSVARTLVRAQRLVHSALAAVSVARTSVRARRIIHSGLFRRRAGKLRFPNTTTKTARRLSRQRDLILTTAKHSFATRRHTELNRLRLNAVRFGDGPELPRLSSRGFRCEKHPRRRPAADKICRVFHTLRVVLAVRHPTFRFAPHGAKCLPSASPIRPRKATNGSRQASPECSAAGLARSVSSPHVSKGSVSLPLCMITGKTLPRDPSTLRPLRPSLCELCVFCLANSRYFSFNLFTLIGNAKNAKALRKAPKDAAARFFASASFAGLA